MVKGIAIASAVIFSAWLLHGAAVSPMTRKLNFSVGTSGPFTFEFEPHTAPVGSLCALTDFVWSGPVNKAWDEADVKPSGSQLQASG